MPNNNYFDCYYIRKRSDPTTKYQNAVRVVLGNNRQIHGVEKEEANQSNHWRHQRVGTWVCKRIKISNVASHYEIC